MIMGSEIVPNDVVSNKKGKKKKKNGEYQRREDEIEDMGEA